MIQYIGKRIRSQHPCIIKIAPQRAAALRLVTTGICVSVLRRHQNQSVPQYFMLLSLWTPVVIFARGKFSAKNRTKLSYPSIGHSKNRNVNKHSLL